MARKPRAEFEITAEDRSRATLDQLAGSMTTIQRAARRAGFALGALVGGSTIADMVQLTDRTNQLATRIRTATRETDDFDAVWRRLQQTAIDTGAELEAGIDTFQALSRVREDLGVTTDEMLTLTEVVQQLGVLGGTSTEAMSNAIRQFNQGLAAGVFRAEEFNSIVENMPELAAELADALDVTQGELRQMVIDGKLLSRDVFNALIGKADDVSARFAEVPTNLDRAFNALETSIASALSELDSAIGLTAGLARWIQSLADAVSTVEPGEAANEYLEVLDEIAEIQASLAAGTGILDALFGFDEQRVLQLGTQLAEAKVRAEELRKVLVDSGGAEVQAAIENARGEIEKLQKQIDGNRVDMDRVFLESLEEDIAEYRLVIVRLEGLLADMPSAQERVEPAAIVDESTLADMFGMDLSTANPREQARQTEERLHQEHLARMRGFESVAQQEAFERELQVLEAKMERQAEENEFELAQALGFKSTRDRQIEEMEDRHQRALIRARNKGNSILMKAELAMHEWEKAKGAEKVNVLLAQTAELTQGFAAHSKQAFQVNKAAQLANAIIDTARGVAYQIGQGNFAAAAVAAAMGAAQIATIQSTQFHGGHHAGGAPGGGGIGGSAPPPLPQLPEPPDLEDRSQNVRLVIELADDAEAGRTLSKLIRVSTDEADDLIFGSNARQVIDAEL